MVNLAALAIIDAEGVKSVLHCFLDRHGVLLPPIPVLVSESVAAELNDCDAVALFVEGLPCYVVPCAILKNDLMLFECIKVLLGFLQKLMLDSLSLP